MLMLVQLEHMTLMKKPSNWTPPMLKQKAVLMQSTVLLMLRPGKMAFLEIHWVEWAACSTIPTSYKN